MKSSPMKYRLRGIKCDNPKCGWKDMTVRQEELSEWIDKPCPCCGENLLTKECLEKCAREMEQIAGMVEVIANLIPDSALPSELGGNVISTFEVDRFGNIKPSSEAKFVRNLSERE